MFPLKVCKQTIAGQWHHAVLAAQLGHRHTAFGLPQDRDDLRFYVSVYLLVFIQNLLVHIAEKIPLVQPLTFGGDCPRTSGAWRRCKDLEAAQRRNSSTLITTPAGPVWPQNSRRSKTCTSQPTQNPRQSIGPKAIA